MEDYERKYEAKELKASTKYRRSEHRILVKREGSLPDGACKGKVIASFGKYYYVSELDKGKTSWEKPVECTSAGTMLNKNDENAIIVVGDNVIFLKEQSLNDDGVETGSILLVEQRDNRFSRTEPGKTNREQIIASNIDILLIMASAKNPQINNRLIDRFLIASELGDVKPIILVNKIDLLNRKQLTEVKRFMQIYEDLYIPVFYISVANNDFSGDLLFSALKSQTSLLIGPSGTGKSSFLNSIMQNEVQRVMEISGRTSKGRHSTSSVRMFFMPDYIESNLKKWNEMYSDWGYKLSENKDGAIIDSPGIREFGLWNVEQDELGLYFNEFAAFDEQCRYIPCTHTHEPDCAVKEAVELEQISIERYASYLNIYDSLDKNR